MKIRTDVIAMLGEHDTRMPVLTEHEIETMQKHRQGQAALAVLSARHGGIQICYYKALEILGCPKKFVLDCATGAIAAKIAQGTNGGMTQYAYMTHAQASRLTAGFSPDKASEKLRKAAVAIVKVRYKRSIRHGPVPSVQKWLGQQRAIKAADLLARHGPITHKAGAGRLFHKVVFRVRVTEPCCETTKESSSVIVARAYRYPVYDHVLNWALPATHRLFAVDDHVVSMHYPLTPKDAEEALVRCWAAKAGKGYSAYFINCTLHKGKLRTSTHSGYSHKV